MDALRGKKGYICDMDGVIYHGNHLLAGSIDFVNWLHTVLVFGGVTTRQGIEQFPYRPNYAFDGVGDIIK